MQTFQSLLECFCLVIYDKTSHLEFVIVIVTRKDCFCQNYSHANNSINNDALLQHCNVAHQAVFGAFLRFIPILLLTDLTNICSWSNYLVSQRIATIIRAGRYPNMVWDNKHNVNFFLHYTKTLLAGACLLIEYLYVLMQLQLHNSLKSDKVNMLTFIFVNINMKSELICLQ